jgi:cell division protein FtsQ
MWNDAKALTALAATLSVMAGLALLAASVHWLARQPAFAIREVVVTTPLIRTSAPHLEAIVRDELAGTFFTMNLERARASIGTVPWVRTVALRRHWPPRLEVAIEEHAPVAHYGEGVLVNTFGETFAATHAGALPRFSGPEGLAGEMTARYREWTTLLAPLALEVNELVLSARGGWRIRAQGNDGPLTLELGRDDPSARLKRFSAAYVRTVGTLARQGTRIEHVDLRYRNGFAARIPGFREGAAKKASS